MNSTGINAYKYTQTTQNTNSIAEKKSATSDASINTTDKFVNSSKTHPDKQEEFFAELTPSDKSFLDSMRMNNIKFSNPKEKMDAIKNNRQTEKQDVVKNKLQDAALCTALVGVLAAPVAAAAGIGVGIATLIGASVGSTIGAGVLGGAAWLGGVGLGFLAKHEREQDMTLHPQKYSQ